MQKLFTANEMRLTKV